MFNIRQFVEIKLFDYKILYRKSYSDLENHDLENGALKNRDLENHVSSFSI